MANKIKVYKKRETLMSENTEILKIYITFDTFVTSVKEKILNKHVSNLKQRLQKTLWNS